MSCRRTNLILLAMVAVGGGGCFRPGKPSPVEEDSARRSEALVRWANSWAAAGDWDMAIVGYTEAIEACPTNSGAYVLRGRAREQTGEWEQAVADCTRAIELAPEDAGLKNDRRVIWGRNGRWDKVIVEYSGLIERRPDDAYAWNNRGWLYATCADAAFRDGPAAVRDAVKACELSGWSDVNIVDTLAAAYAESGDFARAVEMQRKAVAGTRPDPGGGDFGFRGRLKLYQDQKPYRDPPQPLRRVDPQSPASPKWGNPIAAEDAGSK